MSVRLEATSALSGRAVLRRGLQVSPELAQGIWLTLALAMVAAAGRVVVPLAVQQTVDGVVLGDQGAGRLVPLLGGAVVGLVLTGLA
ncbi:MAG TPA: ABC transporter ATP-binding protein, partial [Actinotalea sp.]|nr:ABC transporter ATP-binding protein [Actinotalea sp.]